MYKDKFVLSVIYDGHPVKETGRKSRKEIVVPFDSEYKIRLKNKNDRSCTAKVFIDDKQVSQLGDFIIHAGGTLDLERFVDRSLEMGKKFKFVPLDHEDVDDPTSSDNGIIKVEFRKASQKNGITILPADPWVIWPTQPNTLPPFRTHGDDLTWTTTSSKYTYSGTTNEIPMANIYTCSNLDAPLTKCFSETVVSDGATVEGGSSNQSFTYSNLDVEEHATVLRLKIVGIENSATERSMYKYCSSCGYKIKRKAKFCSGCGHRV